MKIKLFTLLAVMSLAVVSISQNITLKFTGATNAGDYVRLDSVRVQNLSRSWNETVVYPDTVFTLQQTGIADAQGATADIASYPNPFNGTTNVAVTMPQSGDASLQVYNLAGQRVAERTMTLQAGKNFFDVHLQTAQIYLLAVTTTEGRRTVKLINRGTGSENSISYRGCGNVVEKRQSANIFHSGDTLKIEGYVTHNGNVVTSQEVLQQQTSSENITLSFNMPANTPSFSVSNSSRVIFSPGNLQWSAKNGGSTYTTHNVAGGGTAAGTWRFAPNQWDTIGAGNSNIDSTYSGWIDLFGCGTSGYNNICPYMTSVHATDYCNDTFNIQGTNYDWGVYNDIYNPKTNSTDTAGTWRIPTIDEWTYILYTRSTISGIRYAKATVNGVSGLIIVPDNWDTNTYALSDTNTSTVTYTNNVINAATWIIMENAGCVFIPAGGRRIGKAALEGAGSYGAYWTSTCYNNSNMRCLYLWRLDLQTSNFPYYRGNLVRLVKNAN